MDERYEKPLILYSNNVKILPRAAEGVIDSKALFAGCSNLMDVSLMYCCDGGKSDRFVEHTMMIYVSCNHDDVGYIY